MSSLPHLPRVNAAIVTDYADLDGDGYTEQDDRWLAGGLTDLSAGVLGVAVRSPRVRGEPYMPGLVHDLLVRLGHDMISQRDKHDLRLHEVAAHLLVAGVTDLVVQHAQWLFVEGLNDLFDLAALCGIRLWLVIHAPVDDSVQRLIDARIPPEGLHTPLGMCAELQERLDVQTGTVPLPWPTDDSEQLAPPFPEVPRVDAHLFLDTCRDVLEPDGFALVEQLLRTVTVEAVTTLEAALVEAAATAADGKDGRVIVGRAFAEHLSRLLVDCRGDLNRAIVAVRGLQLALFRLGGLAQVDIAPFETFALTDAPDLFTVSDWGWRQLRAYHRTDKPAIAALYVTGVTQLEAIQSLTIADVAPDGSTVTLNGQALSVPEPARVYLRLARLSALVDGRGPSRRLLVNNYGRQVALNTLQYSLHEPRRLLHVMVVPPRRHRTDKDMRRWLARRGIKIRSLA